MAISTTTFHKSKNTNASATQDVEMDTNETGDTLGNTQTEKNSEVVTNNESQQTTHYNTPAQPKKMIKSLTVLNKNRKGGLKDRMKETCLEKNYLVKKKKCEAKERHSIKEVSWQYIRLY